ncbi:hypothetical protein CRG98_036735 [Punica granatum]|uniref:MATH domain-containing protein n=1 Tax=Punica granatum TaxID=22663 RepID=A0A2I0IG17_PUNGR|nr:hypothetical protein CRG98_036735 [Punica granatum]
MESLNPQPVKFTWTLENFSRLNVRKLYSDEFTAGGCKWRLLVFPKGNNVDYVSIYLDVPDASTLPSGWRREAQFSLIMVNQNHQSSSTRKGSRHTFKAGEADWGFTSFKPLAELHTHINGFLVNDALIVEAEVDVLAVHPPVIVPEADRSPPDMEPLLEEVEKAKQYLKECLSDLFKLNMKDRLSAALLALSHAEVGLSSDQQRSIKAFQDNFDDFISDFLTFERDNAEFELQKLARDQEEELKKRMGEVKMRKEKLVSDWEILMTESEEAKSNYVTQEKKLEVVEEKKRIAKERMSRSTTAWSSLKLQFV